MFSHTPPREHFIDAYKKYLSTPEVAARNKARRQLLFVQNKKRLKRLRRAIPLIKFIVKHTLPHSKFNRLLTTYLLRYIKRRLPNNY